MLQYNGNDSFSSYRPRQIYAIRHCERLDNVNQVWYLNHHRFLKDNPPLSDRGIQQAEEVAQCMRSVNIDYLFSSPYERCIETAYRIVTVQKPTKLKIKVEPGLLESAFFCFKDDQMQFPWPSFESASDLALRYADAIDRSYSSCFRGYGSGEENEGKKGCYQRVKETLSKILRTCQGDIVLIGHTSSLDAIHNLLIYYDDEAKAEINAGQATITKYTENPDIPGTFLVDYVTDCSHLSPELRQGLHGNSTFKS